MIYQESRRVRHLVGRLERGDRLVDELTDYCHEHTIGAAEIRGIGRLESLELVRFDAEADDYVPVFDGEGEFDLLNLSGNIARLGEEPVARLQTVISASGPVAPQLLCGQLRSARVVEFEFVMEIFEDLEFDRRLDPESGLLELQAIKRLESGEASGGEQREGGGMGGQSMSWEDAAEAAQGAEGTRGGGEATEETGGGDDEESDSPESIYEEMDLDEPVLEAGDVLEHPKLGRCRVIKVEEGQYAHIRLPRGKIRKLSLSVVDIEFREQENGRNVFEAQVAK